jgi:hypothetical protein
MNMRKIILLAFCAIPFLTNGQINLQRELDSCFKFNECSPCIITSEGGWTFRGTSYVNDTTYDTTKVIMLVVDTSADKTGLRDPFTYWRFGYLATKTTGRYEWDNRWSKATYLDIDKKRLPSFIVVWDYINAKL